MFGSILDSRSFWDQLDPMQKRCLLEIMSSHWKVDTVIGKPLEKPVLIGFSRKMTCSCYKGDELNVEIRSSFLTFFFIFLFRLSPVSQRIYQLRKSSEDARNFLKSPQDQSSLYLLKVLKEGWGRCFLVALWSFDTLQSSAQFRVRLCAGYINSKEDIQTPCLVAFYHRGGVCRKLLMRVREKRNLLLA